MFETNDATLVVIISLLGVTASYSDLRARRIPNALIGIGLIAGVLYHLWLQGFTGISYSLAGSVTGLALFVPFYLFKAMGAGDVKLLAAMGSWLGTSGVLLACGLSLCAGAILAVGWILLSGRGRTASCDENQFLTTKNKPVLPSNFSRACVAKSMPYAPAIAAGSVAAALTGY